LPTYRLVVEYDGTDFAGFQFQATARTVAGELEAALAHLFAGPVKIGAAGRTDAGVHASGQVIGFRNERVFPIERMVRALNANLPPDVSARIAEIVPDGFSPRFDALERRYTYRILNRPATSALLRRYVHHVWQPMDLALANEAAQALIGQHDFIAFCGVLPERGGTVRTVYSIELVSAGEFVELHIAGLGFLHRMVRIITGTLIEVATGRRAVEDVARILAQRDRRQAGYTAPACGLTLVGVRYPDFDSEFAR
jgi:tRNA pseudouridine38-40 synthase